MKRILVVLLAAALSGCGKYKVEKYDEVTSNQTAFVVPLEGSMDAPQNKVPSLDLLRQQKVPSGRVTIEQRKTVTGHRPWQFDWIDTVAVYKIDRSPVTRDWTASPTSGTSAANQALSVESVDSINFCVNSTITTSVPEEDAEKFQYYFAGQTLALVTDTVVRGYMQKEASSKFGGAKITEAAAKMGLFGREMLTSARAVFGPMGIRVDNFGWNGGVRFLCVEIQAKVDELFTAENDYLVALQEKSVVEKQNLILVQNAIAARDAAVKLFESRDAVLLETQLKIKKLDAEAFKAFAERFDGNLPQLVPAGTGLLFGADKAYSSALSVDVSNLPPVPAHLMQVTTQPAAASQPAENG